MTGEKPFLELCDKITPAVTGGMVAVPLLARKEAG